MAKNFPYFKFIATEWLTGDIVFEDYELQGIFINVCALYWQRNGELSLTDLQKRMKTDRLAELTDRFISVNDGLISVKFLDEQLIDAGHLSKVNSENGSKGGRPKKSESPENSEEKTDRLATDNRTESEIKQRKEEEKERKGKEIKEYITRFNSVVKKSFRGDSKTERQFNARIAEGFTIDEMIKALETAKADSYHIETNGKYLTPEFFTRADKIEKFLNAKPATPDIKYNIPKPNMTGELQHD